MFKKITSFAVTLLAAITISAPVLAPVSVLAQNPGEYICGGVAIKIGEPCDPNDPKAEEKINETIRTGLNLFSAIVGIIAVVMVIVGGVTYITSSGDSAKVTKAKNTILYALIGLVVVALSQIIVQFVLGKFAGS